MAAPGVVMLVVMYQKRIEPEFLLHRMNDKIGIARADYRNDAIVIRAGAVTVTLQHFFELGAPRLPIERIFFFVHTAAAAHTLVVERNAEGMVFWIKAACAVSQMTSSG